MEFVVNDPRTLCRAANMQGMLKAFRLMPAVGKKLVEKHNLNLGGPPDDFVPLQPWLDALKEIQELIGPNKVREVGRSIIASANFPPEFDGAEMILGALDAIYKLNIRGDAGRYVVTRPAPGLVVVQCETPFPRIFERGLVEGICQHPRAGGRFSIDYVEGLPRATVTCVMTVQRL